MLPQNMKLVVIPESRAAVSGSFLADEAGRCDGTGDCHGTPDGKANWWPGVMMKAGWKGKTQRLWISSQTDKAIREGFQHLRPAAEYDNLFRSAQARSEADWLVGLNVTRALTCKYNAQLSAGRVQTPTLALIVRREEEIKKFTPGSSGGSQPSCRALRPHGGRTERMPRPSSGKKPKPS